MQRPTRSPFECQPVHIIELSDCVINQILTDAFAFVSIRNKIVTAGGVKLFDEAYDIFGYFRITTDTRMKKGFVCDSWAKES